MKKIRYQFEFIDGTKLEVTDEDLPRGSHRLINGAEGAFIRFPKREVQGHIIYYKIGSIIRMHEISEIVEDPKPVKEPAKVIVEEEIEPPEPPREKTPEEIAEAADRLKASIRGRREEFIRSQENVKKRGPGRPRTKDVEAGEEDGSE